MNLQEALARWPEHQANLAARGIVLDGVRSYLPDEFRHNFALAMDAQPALTTVANSAIPAWLTTFYDPAVIRVLFAANKAAQIFGETKKGTWLDDTAMFHMVEHTGEVSSYGDFNENGRAGVNQQWPQRQQYVFQTMKEVGDREAERAGLARLNWIAEVDAAAAFVLDKFLNLTYFFGVAGLQNYGLLNDPSLTAALTPKTKAAGGVLWFTAGGAVNATANEVYDDIVAIFYQLVAQTAGLVDQNAKVTIAMSPGSALALTFTNSFNVNVNDLLKKNFPNIRIETAVQYGTRTAANPQGNVAGNLVQMIADSIEGQDTGYSAFSDKLRSSPMIRATSSFKQKLVGGTWGSIVLMPIGIASMVGV